MGDSTMTTEPASSTNGRARIEHVIADTRSDLQRRRGRLRPGKLVVPVALALGVLLILRHFEQSTAER